MFNTNFVSTFVFRAVDFFRLHFFFVRPKKKYNHKKFASFLLKKSFHFFFCVVEIGKNLFVNVFPIPKMEKNNILCVQMCV